MHKTMFYLKLVEKLLFRRDISSLEQELNRFIKHGIKVLNKNRIDLSEKYFVQIRTEYFFCI